MLRQCDDSCLQLLHTGCAWVTHLHTSIWTNQQEGASGSRVSYQDVGDSMLDEYATTANLLVSIKLDQPVMRGLLGLEESLESGWGCQAGRGIMLVLVGHVNVPVPMQPGNSVCACMNGLLCLPDKERVWCSCLGAAGKAVRERPPPLWLGGRRGERPCVTKHPLQNNN